MKKCNGVLLIGPTGSGKTPLGEFINNKKLFHKNCIHFDFGANLRRIEQLSKKNKFEQLKIEFSLLENQDIDIIINSLKNSALLKNEQFYIAENILLSFIKEKQISENDIIILNGMPRHTGQAFNIDKIINVKCIIYLNCRDDVVYKRINTNSGGDRVKRIDDSLDYINKKLKIFNDRTIPLINYYKEKNIITYDINISVNTTPEQIYDLILNK